MNKTQNYMSKDKAKNLNTNKGYAFVHMQNSTTLVRMTGMIQK